MDYISHHTLHSHIPIHHHTNHTAVTNHSFALIASPHLHLIHPLTYKQHTYTHPLRSLVFPWLTFLSVLPIHPAISVFHPGLPDLGSLNLCLWPRLLPGIVYVSALPLIFLFLQSHSTSPSTCQSHSTSPSTCQSHPTSPSTCQSHPTSPSTCQSHPTSPSTCQSHPTSPSTCQSHPTSPSTCQSHPTSPLTCQSHLTPPLTCQSHLMSQRSTQCPFTSLLSRPPCPGGLLSHWPHMDLALRPLPRFHLRSTALLDFALCKRLEAALGGGGGGALLWIWLPLTTTGHHPWTTSPIIHCTHTFPSTITPITQLSPITHLPWLPHHTCTSFTHSLISSTHTLTLCEVLFSPG